MKKLLNILACSLLLAGLLGCSSNAAKEKYLQYEAAQANFDYLNAELSQTINVVEQIGDNVVNANISTEFISTARNGEIVEFYVDNYEEIITKDNKFDLELCATVLDNTLYYSDTYELGDLKVMARVEDASINEACVEVLGIYGLSVYPVHSEAIEKVTFTDLGGGKQFDYVINPDLAIEKIHDVVYSAFPTTEIGGYTVKKATGSVVTDNDFQIHQISLDLELEMDFAEGKGTVTIAEERTVVKVGDVVVSIPSDIENYQLID